ncbi:uncharacterized protein LOC106092683 [Stomoxys calcitrans]|uniref:MD-2-related lipid-recognition domain-containing protein n=1 Tax=Stomoxys calcitrans TaxID=35570 RepID=A0A1I8PSM5_STOCA|nr:uncharacterized protein LOC106092683 [Stomoxys calcitrans]XP_059224703.1 uncharacterized protein LOC106092683 [Stomoxys calcitrans]
MMCVKVLKCLIVSLIFQEVSCGAQIHWINCSTSDPSHFKFATCNLRNFKKSDAQFSCYVQVLEPIRDCMVRLETLYLVGRKPIVLLNASCDACELLKNRKRFVAVSRMFDIIADKTNLNHTCPYAHNIFANNLTLDLHKFPFPMPRGKYYMKVSFFVNRDTNKVYVEGAATIF